MMRKYTNLAISLTSKIAHQVGTIPIKTPEMNDLVKSMKYIPHEHEHVPFYEELV